MRLPWFIALLATGLLGCTDQAPACIEVDTTCLPLYTPTFSNVYTVTLRNSCGSTDASCHSAAGRQGGMSFATESEAYSVLLDGRVMPGNPGCSKIVVRTSSPGADYQMPPGDALEAGERCSLIQWVQAGAQAGSAAAFLGPAGGHP